MPVPAPPGAPIADPIERGLSPGHGRAPTGGFAPLTPELGVTDIAASLAFWCGLLGFTVAFDRPAARFAYLEREGAQIMLCECNGRWEPGEMQRPFGRGINLQITVGRVAPVLDALQAAGWPLYEAPADTWYRAGESEVGQREFLVQDPDGYLVRLAESLGRRPAG
jgi:catechol 2,3-dioxygenase-like lactoylglutathione lyase family enzyme